LLSKLNTIAKFVYLENDCRNIEDNLYKFIIVKGWEKKNSEDCIQPSLK
jgi:hypothetical protein